MTRELDACGIGFVTDVHGRTSRTIVTAALQGLAGVRHRGAVAADARTSDGTGLLTPIPRAIFGEDTGVAMLLVRDRDPRSDAAARAAVADAAGAEGLDIVDWRTPPVDPDTLGDIARASRPELVQAIFANRDRRLPGDERAAYRFRRRLPRRPPRLVRGVVLVPHHRAQGPGRSRRVSPTSTSTSPTRRLRGVVRHLPPALLDQHPADVGAGPALPHAVPQRRDQHHRRQREPHAGPRPCSAPRPPGSARGALFRPLLDPGDSDSGKLDETVELLHAGRPHRAARRGHAGARGVGGRARPRARGARLLPVPRRAHGAVGRTGRPHLHRRPRRGRRPRPQRPAPAALRRLRATASWSAARRWARST